jgi:hypothetical protein
VTEEKRKTFMLMGVRAGQYVHLITPRQGKPYEDGTLPPPKYELELIVPRNHPQFQALKDEQRSAVQRAFGTEWEAKLTGLAARDRVLLHNGDATRIGKPAYAGMAYISAKNTEQPTIIVSEGGENIATRGTKRVLLPSHKHWPFAGCMVNVELDIYAYKKSGGGVTATALGVQFAGDGQRLGNAQVSSAGAFGIVATDVDGAAPTQSSASDGLI